MTTSERVKLFFKPSISKVVLSIILLVYAFFNTMIVYPWGHSFSWVSSLFFTPILLGPLFLLLVIPFSYTLSCFFVWIFIPLKSKKWLFVIVVMFFVLLAGFDEPIINSTVNKPDYSCSVDSDCVAESISRGWCGNLQCVNVDWEYYDSMINSVFALSCSPPMLICSCVENKCESKDFREVIRESVSLEDCENLEGGMRSECRYMVEYNIELENSVSS